MYLLGGSRPPPTKYWVSSPLTVQTPGVVITVYLHRILVRHIHSTTMRPAFASITVHRGLTIIQFATSAVLGDLSDLMRPTLSSPLRGSVDSRGLERRRSSRIIWTTAGIRACICSRGFGVLEIADLKQPLWRVPILTRFHAVVINEHY